MMMLKQCKAMQETVVLQSVMTNHSKHTLNLLLNVATKMDVYNIYRDFEPQTCVITSASIFCVKRGAHILSYKLRSSDKSVY